ncbi:hypothetical protein [Klebsiella pneumoniae]|uniref:hypothetical protein n=1 Tax=Klebsiella pneumoniae TaxID=573 RepID=UPI00296F6929|nr:hypothetical protein [Klebsiella pneumoniae]MDW3840003.1 hypothetical protein [Klebsiella pneumoniae]
MNKTKGCLIANFATVPRDEQQHRSRSTSRKSNSRSSSAHGGPLASDKSKNPAKVAELHIRPRGFPPDRRRGFFLLNRMQTCRLGHPEAVFSPRSSIAASDDAETTRPRTSSCSIAIADDGTRSPAVATDLELASPHPTMRAGVDHRQV